MELFHLFLYLGLPITEDYECRRDLVKTSEGTMFCSSAEISAEKFAASCLQQKPYKGSWVAIGIVLL